MSEGGLWSEGGEWKMNDESGTTRSFRETRKPEPGQAELKPNGWDNPTIRLIGEIEERDLPLGPDGTLEPTEGCAIIDLGTGHEIAFRRLSGFEGIRSTELIGLEEI